MKMELNIDTNELIEAVSRKVIEALKPTLSQTSSEDRLLTVEELCHYLQVDKGWVYQQVHSKAIPHLKSGRFLRFRKSEIDDYLSKGDKTRL